MKYRITASISRRSNYYEGTQLHFCHFDVESEQLAESTKAVLENVVYKMNNQGGIILPTESINEKFDGGHTFVKSEDIHGLTVNEVEDDF